MLKQVLVLGMLALAMPSFGQGGPGGGMGGGMGGMGGGMGGMGGGPGGGMGGMGGGMGGMGGGMGGMGGGMDMGNFDPATMQAQMQQQQMDNLKLQMAPTDDEWKNIEPKLKAVQTAQQAAQSSFRGGMGGMMGGGMGGMGGGMGGMMGGGMGGMGGGMGGAAPAAGSLAAVEAELRTLVNDPTATSAKITEKLKEYRAALTKFDKALADAQKALAGVVNPKQEAFLVANGYLK